MFSSIFNATLWQLIAQSDMLSKLVLLALMCLSVVCTAIIAFKWWYLRTQKKQAQQVCVRLRKAKTFEDLRAVSRDHRDTTAGAFLQSLLDESDIIHEGNEGEHVGEHDIECFELVLSQQLDAAVMEAELYLPILGTSAAVAPLVGLFGTVWGLVHAFISISQEKTADITVVAPGIAEALLTTLAGLVVAIPAMIFFHYFSNDIRKIEHKLVTISDLFISVAKKIWHRKGK